MGISSCASLSGQRIEKNISARSPASHTSLSGQKTEKNISARSPAVTRFLCPRKIRWLAALKLQP